MTPPWVVVLGVSSGFGAATAAAFAAAGHPILGVHLDRRATAARVTAAKAAIEAHGVPVQFHDVNAADPRRRAEVLGALTDASPDARVGVLVHSLAFGSLRPLTGAPDVRAGPRHLEMTLGVMAHSLVGWVQDLLDRDLFAADARVFALSSDGARRVIPDYGPVAAAKAALEAYVRQLAVELAPRGITVNAVVPGVCSTPALDAIPGGAALADRARAHHPAGRLTRPDDVARCLVALASPGTAWLTGNVLWVDGGESITA